MEYFDYLLAEDLDAWSSFMDGIPPVEDGGTDSDSDESEDEDEDEGPRLVLVDYSAESDEAGIGERRSGEDSGSEGGSLASQDSDSGVDDADLVALGAGPEDLR